MKIGRFYKVTTLRKQRELLEEGGGLLDHPYAPINTLYPRMKWNYFLRDD